MNKEEDTYQLQILNLLIKFTSPHPIQIKSNKPLNQGDGMGSIHSFI